MFFCSWTSQAAKPSAFYLKINMSLEEFLSEWNNDSPFIEVKTSGSTGEPKRMLVEKRRMLASARITCDFLGLRPGDTALLCMSLDYIAGKMMVVRALERHLTLLTIPPTGHPLSSLSLPSSFLLPPSSTNESPSSSNDSPSSFLLPPSSDILPPSSGILPPSSFLLPRFTALVPLQVYNTLQVPEERERLMQVEHLIIGGGAIDEAMEAELRQFPNAVWSSRGLRVVHALPLCPSVPLRRRLPDHRCPRGLRRNPHHQRHRRIVSPRGG